MKFKGKKKGLKDPIHGALFGLVVGDALGVPVEMIKRDVLKQNPVQDLIGYKEHDQPPGTFSDDSSLTFCLAESLCNGYDLSDMGKRFVQYFFDGYWTAGGKVFGVGKTTQDAITRLRDGVSPDRSGNYDENCSGNGSLMRILPLLFYIRDLEIDRRYEIIRQVASITHGSMQTILPCFFYLEFALELLAGKSKLKAYINTANTVSKFIAGLGLSQQNTDVLAPLLQEDITQRSIVSILTTHQAVLTIQAAMYCFMKTDNYSDAVLMAVNMGDDTDTTAAVTGGLAGMYYGINNIPDKWKTGVQRSNDITNLCDRLSKATGFI